MSTKEPNLQESNVRQVQATIDEYIKFLMKTLEDADDDRQLFVLGKTSGLAFARGLLDDMWDVVETLDENRRIGE